MATLAEVLPEVALRLLGQPFDETDEELRFGKDGSLHVSIHDGDWSSDTDGAHGTTLDLIVRVKGCDLKDAAAWLRDWWGDREDQLIGLPNGANHGADPFQARAPLGFRTPPHNLDAEQALLGAILINNEAYHRVAGFLRAEHFYELVHGRTFAAIKRLVDAGRLADPVTLAEFADQDPDLQQVNGRRHLANMAAAATTALNVEDYGRVVQDLAIRRGLILASESAANKAYDAAAGENAAQQLLEAREQLERISNETVVGARPCTLRALDWARVANEPPPAQRWLIDEWIPMGTSGIVTGPGASGKSFLELIRMICLSTGRKFLDHYAVEPAPCLGYFSEDSLDVLWARARKICAGLQIDPAILIGRLEIVSTVGAHKTLITAEHNNPITIATEWMSQVHDRARALGARYIGFDHVGRYLAINRNDPNQVFSAFGHFDAVATSIDGSIGLLAHPSKTDIRNKAKAGGSPIVGYVGGSAAMIDAPRWVQVLDTVKFPDGKKLRILTNEKPNYSIRFAVKLEENQSGIVTFAGEVDPDDPAGENSNSSRGRKSNADRTLIALEESFHTHRRAIHVDELIPDCIKRGIFVETSMGTDAWRNLRRTVREHLNRFPKHVEIRDDGSFALKP